MYYYGYGVDKNIERANELLGNNLDVNPTKSNATIKIGEEVKLISNKIEILADYDVIPKEVSNNNLLGKWKGLLLMYDWSGKFIENNYPITISFKKDSINNSSFYVIEILNQKILNPIIRYDDLVFFENTKIELPHITFDEKIPNKLYYEFKNTDLEIQKIGSSNYLMANIQSYINEWNETGRPLKLVLKKTETFANSNQELSDEVLKAILEQKENFIKLYPNPFEKELIISYTLEETSFVEVKITGANGIKNIIIKKEAAQNEGSYSYFFDANTLGKGAYIVSVIINNQRKTRIIVKN